MVMSSEQYCCQRNTFAIGRRRTLAIWKACETIDSKVRDVMRSVGPVLETPMTNWSGEDVAKQGFLPTGRSLRGESERARAREGERGIK